MTKTAFLDAYRGEVLARYPHRYAADPDRLAKLMSAAAVTIRGEGIPWHWEGPASLAAFRAVGGKGKLTLKGLRALAD